MSLISQGNIINRKKSSSGFFSKIVFLLALLIFVLGYLVYRLGPEPFYMVALLWIVTVSTLLWFGNRFIYNILNKKISWVDHTSKRFFLQLVLNVVYSLCCINLTYYLFVQTTDLVPDLEDFFVLNVYGLLFIIPVLSINFCIFFMVQWKKSYVQSNKLKEENLRTQLDSLRMHIDPHFLFNNLNILSSLIQQDQKNAQLFLYKFADVYRYVLQYKKEELVALSTELEFIKAYIFLLKKRFDDQLTVSISVPEVLPYTAYILPLSLQMLVENAVKHNKNSKEEPLEIHIFVEDNKYLVVRNSYNPIQAEDSDLAKTGLENIRKRYTYLSESSIIVIQDQACFTVKLPLLEMA